MPAAKPRFKQATLQAVTTHSNDPGGLFKPKSVKAMREYEDMNDMLEEQEEAEVQFLVAELTSWQRGQHMRHDAH